LVRDERAPLFAHDHTVPGFIEIVDEVDVLPQRRVRGDGFDRLVARVQLRVPLGARVALDERFALDADVCEPGARDCERKEKDDERPRDRLLKVAVTVIAGSTTAESSSSAD
jgi:hypothetical protein